MKVIAIIADIVKSKDFSERDQLQKKISRILTDLSNNSNGIISPYTITLGDEFQAVYKNVDEVISDIMNILSRLYPVKIRFALGVNEITTEVNNKNALGMDGPAFHVAREGIEFLKKYDHSVIQIYNGENEDFDFINKSLLLNFAIMDSWKENTMKIYDKLSNNKRVKEIVNEMDISQRAIYKIMNTNKLLNYVEYFKSLENEIKDKIDR